MNAATESRNVLVAGRFIVGTGGVFFTIYYVVMMVGPRFGGGLVEAAGDAGVAILAGAGMSLAAALCLLLFRRATV